MKMLAILVCANFLFGLCLYNKGQKNNRLIVSLREFVKETSPVPELVMPVYLALIILGLPLLEMKSWMFRIREIDVVNNTKQSMDY